VINPSLFKQPVAVDSAQHRALHLAHPVRDWSVAADMNAVFVASVEFGDACCEYPLVFVDAGKDESNGQQLVAPIAVLGLTDKQNLFAEGGQWRAVYLPALLRAYPFGIARQDEERVLVVVDRSYEGWSSSEGQALFDEQGQPSALLSGMREQLETIETEIQRTRMFGAVLVEEGLLQPMRFDATLPDGKTMTVEGFLTVDEKKLAELPEAKIAHLHKNGILGLIHAHQISLRHMRRLVDWHTARLLAAASPETVA
jgi:SapC